MFKIKRPAIVGLLLIMLIFTGYLNYELTQQALTKTSKNYQRYEELEKAKYQDNIQIATEDSKTVDEEINKEDDVSEVVSAGNEVIDKNLASKDNNDSTIGSKNYFVEHRLSRDKLRANLVERLDEIVKNQNTEVEVRTEAQEEIMKIGRMSEKELQIEGLVKSKGYSEVITFLTDQDIKIVVASDELSEQDMVKILDIVKSETNYDVNNIKISNK